MKAIKVWFRRFFYGNSFGVTKLKFDIDTGLPERQTIKDIVLDNEVDKDEVAAAFTARVKTKDEFKPLPLSVNGHNGKGEPLFKGLSAEEVGIILKRDAEASAEISRKNNEKIEAEHQKELERLGLLPPAH